MFKLSASFVASSLSEHLVKPLTSPVNGELSKIEYAGVTTDSRAIRPGSLFVGVKGDTFDGNKFAEAALEAGAAGVISEIAIDAAKWPDRQIFQVKDSLSAFRSLAKSWRSHFSKPVIAVAGSVGKTTTKEMIASVCQARWKSVLRTESSHNGFVGIPMTLLNLRDHHDIAVIEVGIDEVGAMIQHWELVQPDTTIITVTGPEHLEKLIDIETAAAEEIIILRETFKASKKIILNLDDDRILNFAQRESIIGPNVWGFTLKPTPAKIEVAKNQLVAGVYWEKDNTLDWCLNSSPLAAKLKAPLVGNHNASNLLATVTVALSLGIETELITTGIGEFKTPSGRSEIQKLASGQTVVCDYYNANPSSVQSALQMTRSIHRSNHPATGKTWACLGDMLELGTHEERLHRGLADAIIAEQLDEVILIGKRMKWLEDELKRRETKGKVRHFDDHESVVQVIRKEIGAKDTILIKGSRGLRMERVWEVLKSLSF